MLVIVGGVIPDDDVDALKQEGVSEVFHPATTIPEIAAYIRARGAARDAGAPSRASGMHPFGRHPRARR